MFINKILATAGATVIALLVLNLGCAPQAEMNAGANSSAADVLPTYDDLNLKIFQVHCIGCHSSSLDNGIDFSTYQTLMNSMNAQGGLAVFPGDYESSRIWIRTRPSGGMPPDSSQLPAGANLAIQNWILQGANQN